MDSLTLRIFELIDAAALGSRWSWAKRYRLAIDITKEIHREFAERRTSRLEKSGVCEDCYEDAERRVPRDLRMAAARFRVAAGAAWLDEHVPDWVQRINDFDLASEHACIIAQLYGGWVMRPDELRERSFELVSVVTGGPMSRCVLLGFNSQPRYDPMAVTTRDLDPLWRELIAERQAQCSVTQ